MAGRDMKFTASFDDNVSKGLDSLSKKIQEITRAMGNMEKQRVDAAAAGIQREQKVRDTAAADYVSWWKRALAAQDAGEKQRIAMQRASIALEERMEKQRAAAMEANSRNTLQVTQSRAAAASRIERQAAQAEASLVLDKFDRRIAIEKVKHAQILADLKGNDAAIEAETRRHNAVVSRINMDKANFANTPFQKMLEGFNKLNNGLGKAVPVMTTAAGQIGTMSTTMATAAGAASAFGGALSSLTMGPMGAAILAATALSAGVNSLIDAADRAATVKGNQGKMIQDPAQLKLGIEALQAYQDAAGKVASAEAARAAGRGGDGDWLKAIAERARAMRQVQSQFGESPEALEAHGTTLATLKFQQEALAKRLKGHEKFTDDYRSKEEELAHALNATIEDQTARAIAEENTRNKYAMQALQKGSLTAELEMKLHEANLTRIAKEGQEQRLSNAADATIAAFKAQMEKEHQAARAQQADRDKAVAADEARTDQIYKARDRLAKAQGAGGSAMDKLKAKQAVELEEYAGNETAKTAILKAQELERTALEKEESQKRIDQQKKEREERLAATAQFFGGFAALAAQANMKDRQNRIRWKALATAEAITNTSLAATKALTAAPPPFNFIAMAGVIAAGLSQVNQIKDQKFATGTDYAPGGMALVGEQGPEMVYLPRGSQVKTAPETRRLMAPSSQDIHIHVVAGPGVSASQAVEQGRSIATGFREEMRLYKATGRDAAWYGAKA